MIRDSVSSDEAHNFVSIIISLSLKQIGVTARDGHLFIIIFISIKNERKHVTYQIGVTAHEGKFILLLQQAS